MDCQKHLFNLDPDVTYLNCAYMSPLMKEVEEAGIEGIRRKNRPHSIPAEDFFRESDLLREEFSKLVNAGDPKRTVVIPSASYGLANVAKNLKLSAGDNIIVAGEQFPSNIYPWREAARQSGAEIRTVPGPDVSENRGTLWNQHILEAIDSRTRLVATGHIHWADGTVFDLRAIRKRTEEVGAWMVIDGTQSIGALPFDIQELRPDALVAAGYKSLMGPYSIGMAYYGPALDGGSPVEENWINRYKSEDFANLVNYSDDYQPGALRYEVGEHSNFILVPMLLTAVRKLNEWGPGNIQEYCEQLISEPLEELREHGYQVEHRGRRAANLFGIRPGAGHTLEKIKKRLSDARIFISYRGDAIRISPNIYNDKSDITHLVETLIRY